MALIANDPIPRGNKMLIPFVALSVLRRNEVAARSGAAHLASQQLPVRSVVRSGALDSLPQSPAPSSRLFSRFYPEFVSKPIFLRPLVSLLILSIGFVLFFHDPCVAIAQDASIEFDVPALLCAHPIEDANLMLPVTGPVQATATLPRAEPRTRSLLASHRMDVRTDGPEKIVEVVVPVTTELRPRRGESTESFRFDVFWNRIAFPLVDYLPKTQTISEVAGVVAVETSDEHRAGVGLNLNAKYESTFNGALNGQLANNQTTKKRFEEIPQHDVLVASGTSHRGTGAFFRFHPSRQDTLEGGRDLVVAFQVPNGWRAGVLKVECHAMGKRRVIGSWKEDFDHGRAFIVPVYLDHDDEARKAAVDFVRSEQRLRKTWASRSPAKPLGLFAFNANSSSKSPPEEWVHVLIQSGNDDYLEKYRAQLSEEVVEAADRFVLARQNLLKLER